MFRAPRFVINKLWEIIKHTNKQTSDGAAAATTESGESQGGTGKRASPEIWMREPRQQKGRNLQLQSRLGGSAPDLSRDESIE